MADRREEIISSEVGNDPYLYRPDVKKVMDEYMKECSLELLTYVAKKVSNFWIDDNGEAKFKLSGDEELTKEQLFENFL